LPTEGNGWRSRRIALGVRMIAGLLDASSGRINFDQNVVDFSRSFLGQSYRQPALKFGRPFGLTVPNHEVASCSSPYKEARWGRFVSHFLSLSASARAS
jgi:hypothetical protein